MSTSGRTTRGPDAQAAATGDAPRNLPLAVNLKSDRNRKLVGVFYCNALPPEGSEHEEEMERMAQGTVGKLLPYAELIA